MIGGRTARCDLLIESLACCREHKGLAVHAFVVLDNHLHAILNAPDLTRVMADFKRHPARRILAQLEAERCEWLMHELRHYCDGSHGTEYQLWQEGFHPQAIMGDAMMEQKLRPPDAFPVNRAIRGIGVSPK